MLSMAEMNEQSLKVAEAETRTYEKVLSFITRMIPPEPYYKHDNDKKHREWEKETRVLRALKCDVLEEYIRTDRIRSCMEKQVEEDKRKVREEQEKESK